MDYTVQDPQSKAQNVVFYDFQAGVLPAADREVFLNTEHRYFLRELYPGEHAVLQMLIDRAGRPTYDNPSPRRFVLPETVRWVLVHRSGLRIPLLTPDIYSEEFMNEMNELLWMIREGMGRVDISMALANPILDVG